MKMHHAMLLRSARIKKKKFNALFDDVVFEKSRVVDRAKTAWKKAKSIARGALKETPATQFEGIRTDSFYKIESGFEYGNAWDIVARLNALANTRPMHWLEEEGKIFDVCESELSSRFLDESEDENDDLDDGGSIKMNDINNDTKKSNNNAVNMKKALKSIFTRSSAENEDDSDGDEGDEDEDDEGNDDADVSDPSDDDNDEDEIETNINTYEDEAPFERNLRLRAKAERFEHKKNKKIREAKKIAFQRLLDIQDETVKNRVRLNHRVLELEQTKHKVQVEVLSLEYRAARVFERLSRIEILDDEYETMSRPDETLERLQREAREAKTAFENHGPELANAKMRLEATSDQLKMNERQFRRETRDSPAAAIHADTLLVLYRQDGSVLHKKNTSSSSASSSSSSISTGHNATSSEVSSLAAERTKLRRESVFSPASMMQMRSKSIVALTSSGGDVVAEKGATTAAAVAPTTHATRNSKPATYFLLSLDETWFEKLNAHRTQRQNLEKVKAQQKATRETCEVTLKVLEQTLDEATKRVTERRAYLKNQFNERFERANDCDVTMKLPCGLVETLFLDEDESNGDDGAHILYLPRNIVEELNTAANSRRDAMINLRIAKKKLSTSIECSKWCIEYAKRRNSEHIERARELALLRSSKSLQLFIKSGGYSKNSLEENNNKKKRNGTSERGDGDDDDDDDIDEKEIGDAANAKARFRHDDALHEKERKMCEERLNELEKKKAKLRKTIASLLIEDEHKHLRSPEMMRGTSSISNERRSRRNDEKAFVISVQ